MATYILVAMQMPVTIRCCALFCSCSLEFIGHGTVFFSHGKISSANISAAKSIRRTAQFADSCFAAFGRRCTLAGDGRFAPSRSSRRRKGARHSFPPHLNSPFIRTRMALPHCHTTVHRSPGVVRAKAKHTETAWAEQKHWPPGKETLRPSAVGRRQTRDPPRTMWKKEHGVLPKADRSNSLAPSEEVAGTGNGWPPARRAEAETERSGRSTTCDGRKARRAASRPPNRRSTDSVRTGARMAQPLLVSPPRRAWLWRHRAVSESVPPRP